MKKLVLAAAAGVRVPEAKMGELFIDDLPKLSQLLFFDQNDPSIPLAMPSRSTTPASCTGSAPAKPPPASPGTPTSTTPASPQHLHRVECPTLLLWGRHDKLLPLGIGEFYAKHIYRAPASKSSKAAATCSPSKKPIDFVARTVAFLND